MNIQLEPVSSSQISARGYDAPSQTLRIKFSSGGVYDYSNFPEEEFEKFRSAESAGSHFFKHIKSKPDLFPYRKLTAEELA